MTTAEYGYKAWVREFKESRRCDESELQREADEYVRGYLRAQIAARREAAEEEDVPDEEGFVTVRGPRRTRAFNVEDVDPVMREVNAVGRKRRRPTLTPAERLLGAETTPATKKFYRALRKHGRAN